MINRPVMNIKQDPKVAELGHKLKEKADRMIGALDNEGSRYNFTYHPKYHPKGRWLGDFLKKLIIGWIGWTHRQILRHYDEHAYEFQDPRLFLIKLRVQESVKWYMEERKQQIILNALDICLFVLKEDSYYRNWFIRFIDQWCMEYADFNHWHGAKLFDLDDVEQRDYEQWRGK